MATTAPAGASGYPVWDMARFFQDMIEHFTEAMRWGEQGDQWITELNQFRQQFNSMLSNIQSMQSIMGLPQGVNLREVDEDFMVRERCGEEAYGGGAAGLVGRLTSFKPDGDLYQQRYNICARTQIMRNKQYNEMVRFMTTTSQEMKASLERAADKAKGRKTSGEMSGALADMQSTNDRVQQKYADFEARMDGYDTYIAMSGSENTTLTKGALRGSQDLIKKVTTTAILAERLCGGGKCSN